VDFRDVLIKPVITEKSMEATQNNKYTFIVNLKANKSQIKEAIEKIFKVKVIKVNSMKIIGK
jgi:large subunit ribosomal protein L23